MCCINSDYFVSVQLGYSSSVIHNEQRFDLPECISQETLSSTEYLLATCMAKISFKDVLEILGYFWSEEYEEEEILAELEMKMMWQPDVGTETHMKVLSVCLL